MRLEDLVMTAMVFADWASKDAVYDNNVSIDLFQKNNQKSHGFTKLETVEGWLNGRKPWEKVFFRILKDKGVEAAYVSTKNQEEKFYAIVSENSVNKMLELSKIYNDFLVSYTKYVSEPYFEFVVFGKNEISACQSVNQEFS